jgi:putative protease
LSEIRVDLKPVDEAKKGDYFSIAVKDKVRRNDKLFKWEDNKITK